MRIRGTISCLDTHDLCEVNTFEGQTGSISCLDSTDSFQSYGFIIGQTTSLATNGTFYQGQLLNDSTGLSLNLRDSTIVGWTSVDGTYVDGTYISRTFNPYWINYGIYFLPDASHEVLQGYRFRTPMNPQVGSFYANMEAPSVTGNYRIRWIYEKSPVFNATAVNQDFYVDYWSNRIPTWSSGVSNAVTVTVLPTYQLKMLGETAVFNVTYTGTMSYPLTYQWRKGGVDLVDGGHYFGTDTATLTVLDVTPSEYSFYDCVVAYHYTSNQVWLVVDP